MRQFTGNMVILIGPSGVGKSSFIDRLLKEEKKFYDLITYTTRDPRPGEQPGVSYHFVTQEKFEELKAKDFFVETANVHGKFYGTPWEPILEAGKRGETVIMDVDVQGARVFKKIFPKALTIFMEPPSIDTLRQRILARGTVSNIDVRIQTAANEMKAANEFDFRIVNDRFETAYQVFRNLIEKLLKNQ